MKRTITGLIYIVLGFLTAYGPYTFLHVCGAGMVMEGMGSPVCQGIPPFTLVAGILLFVAGGFLIFSQIREEHRRNGLIVNIVNVAAVILGVAIIGAPTFIIGVCEEAHMHCHMVTRPALIVMGAVVVVTAGIALITDLILHKGEPIEEEAIKNREE